MDTNIWNNFVKSNPCSFYHLYKWGQLLEDVHHQKIFYLYYSGGVLPIAHVPSIFFGNRLISLPFADYGGLCAINKEAAKKLIHECEKLGTSLDVDYIEVRSLDKEFSAIFSEYGFIAREDYFTYVLNLDLPLSQIWSKIGKKNRNAIRKAQNHGLEVTWAEKKKDLEIFYAIYLKTMKKLGSPPQPYIFFQTLWELFGPEQVKIAFVKYTDKYVASSIYFIYEDTMHHAYNCSLPEYKNLAPNNLLQWNVIMWGCEHNYRTLDFGRTRENAGNDLFKKRWGGEKKFMTYYYKFFRKQIGERDEIKYKWISNLWSKYLPDWIASLLGPWLIRQIG
jgi:FemAB-related protein (PEP-CTERM system-associated)